MYAQDPNFGDADRTFLEYLHINVSDNPNAFQGQVDGNSILYCPHLDYRVDLRRAYQAPHPVLIFTNLASYTEELLRTEYTTGSFHRDMVRHQRQVVSTHEWEVIPSWIPIRSEPEAPTDRMWRALADMRLWVRRDVYSTPQTPEIESLSVQTQQVSLEGSSTQPRPGTGSRIPPRPFEPPSTS